MDAQRAVAVSALLAGAWLLWYLTSRTEPRVAEAGFWFEPVTFESPRLDGAVTPHDLKTIRRVARGELASAFADLRVRLSESPSARYRVRVVQQLLDRRFRREVAIAGESRAIPGLGGSGAVSFYFLASGAIASASARDDRAALIEAIGRGVGRAAVHEFVHQFLPSAPIHDSRDVGSYEYASAARREQYFGEMRWGLARPLLQRTLGSADESR
jgi:hypothetical protein